MEKESLDQERSEEEIKHELNDLNQKSPDFRLNFNTTYQELLDFLLSDERFEGGTPIYPNYDRQYTDEELNSLNELLHILTGEMNLSFKTTTGEMTSLYNDKRYKGRIDYNIDESDPNAHHMYHIASPMSGLVIYLAYPSKGQNISQAVVSYLPNLWAGIRKS